MRAWCIHATSIKWAIPQKQYTRVGVIHSNQSKMLGDSTVTCTHSLSALPFELQGPEWDWQPGSLPPQALFAHNPSLPSEYLITLYCSCRQAKGALAPSSLPAEPRALCRWLTWGLADASSGPSGQRQQF